MLNDKDQDRIIGEFEVGFKTLSSEVEVERKRQFLLMQEKRKKRRLARENEFGDKEMAELSEEMGLTMLNNKVRALDGNSTVIKMLNSWKQKSEEKARMHAQMQEAKRLENLYTTNPGALITELLKRVKSLENLLKGI